MKYILLNAIIFFLAITSLLAQPAIQWDKTIGSLQNDAPGSMEQTSDGGFILVGTSGGGIGGDKSEPSKGSSDFWIVKLAADGTKQWDKTIGSPGSETAAAIRQTSDGGYIVGGSSGGPAGSDKSERSRGGSDFWVVKLDASGNKIWDKTFGGDNGDGMVDLRQTPDGGYVLAGVSTSGISGEKSEPRLDDFYNDFWVVKINAAGTLEWERTLGTSGPDRMRCMTLTADGGAVFGGEQGYEEQSSGYYLVKVSGLGVKEWDRRIGGTIHSADEIEGWADISDIQQTPDGGFILGGTSIGRASGDQSEPSINDYWIVKLDADRAVEWDNVIATDFVDGDKFSNTFVKLAQAVDGGYLLLGYSASFASGEKSEDSHNLVPDFWLVKLNSAGAFVWDKTIGGPGYERALSIVNTSDKGFALLGLSVSDAGFEKTENAKGANDLWIVKLAAEEPPLPVTLKNFSSAKENTTALLTWETTSETNSDHFEVQHSLDGKDWNQLTSINAQGESTKMSFYNYTHTTPVSGSENFYRLKMVDADGAFAYSKIQHLRFDQSISVSVYPNPVTETIHLQTADWSKVKGVQVVNNQGKTLYNSGNKPSQDINAKSFKPGLYFIKVTLTDGRETTRKVVVGQ
ncbi:T9SS type A sorting domain-containing protein [Dyadobacter sandarakinus]|uniref:T9SS type A sorting domain-containing protein n=1 Tax=Dyadobacter sandarakinus TaxID=2747268 RepID=A0ABX7I8X8_9BACT|nr:T9SS type A sorting domain-containing protein [Dyadobacter sandarakinus]QRR01431.1 T9SS type A sorting domain-containing protein [Dyadobacter sandarakinus]